MKRIIFVVMLFLFSLLFSKNIFAGGFVISSIGGVTTNNKQVSKFWHTSLRPVFRGTALPGANIDITVDGTAVQIAADSAGEWVYTPISDLTAGTHEITFASNGSTQKLTLTTGSVGDGSIGGWSDASNSALPASGVAWPTIMLLIIGGSSMLIGKRFLYNKE